MEEYPEAATVEDVDMPITTVPFDPGQTTKLTSSPTTIPTTLAHSPSGRGSPLHVANYRTTFSFDQLSPEQQFVSKVLSVVEAAAIVGEPPSARDVWETCEADPWWRAQRTAIAHAFTSDEQLIEDLTQEAGLNLASILNNEPTLGLKDDQIAEKFVRWLSQRTRENLIALLRPHWERTREESLNEGDYVEKIEPLCSLEKQEIRAAVAELADEHQAVLSMLSDGCKGTEIAQHLAMSIYKVRRIIGRCRRILRQRLKAFTPDEAG
jgi:RNA polymerase sigma factor (sigma-70 family)